MQAGQQPVDRPVPWAARGTGTGTRGNPCTPRGAALLEGDAAPEQAGDEPVGPSGAGDGAGWPDDDHPSTAGAGGDPKGGGSPLEGKVVECHPSGSSATDTAVASRVSQGQHDVVMELDTDPLTPPLLLTCAKPGVSLWDYLGYYRLGVPGAAAPRLTELVRMRSPPA